MTTWVEVIKPYFLRRFFSADILQASIIAALVAALGILMSTGKALLREI